MELNTNPLAHKCSPSHVQLPASSALQTRTKGQTHAHALVQDIEGVGKAAGSSNAEAGTIAGARGSFSACDPQACLPPCGREGAQIIGMATLGTNNHHNK
eukprot:1146599-Pelagomonas_calceolata.AAC.4